MALTNEQYRRVEGALYRYARACIRIEELQAEVAEADRQMAELERELHYWLDLSPRVTGVIDVPAVDCSPIDSPVERAYEQAESRREHLRQRWMRLRERRNKLLERIADLRLQTVRIDTARQRLSDLDGKIFELRYFNEWRNTQIANELHYTEKAVRNHIRKIVLVMSETVCD